MHILNELKLNDRLVIEKKKKYIQFWLKVKSVVCSWCVEQLIFFFFYNIFCAEFFCVFLLIFLIGWSGIGGY